jgi:hypothetical protein
MIRSGLNPHEESEMSFDATTLFSSQTVKLALALSATSTALASSAGLYPDECDPMAKQQVSDEPYAPENTDYKTKSDTISPEELESIGAADAKDAAAEIQSRMADELGKFGETSIEIIFIDELGKATLFEMFFNVPDHRDRGSFIDFVIDENFGQGDMAGFTDDVLLGGLGLDRPGESVKGVVIPSEGGGLFGGMGGIPELNTSVEFKRSWELSGNNGFGGPGALRPFGSGAAKSGETAAYIGCQVAEWIYGCKVCAPAAHEPSSELQDTLDCWSQGKGDDGGGSSSGSDDWTYYDTDGDGEVDAADTDGDGSPDTSVDPSDVPEGASTGSADTSDADADEESNPAPDETGDLIMTQAQKDEFRASVTPDQSAARAVGASLLAIMFRNVSNPVPEERGASSRGTGDLLGDCAGLPPWECSGDSLGVSAVGQSGIMITGLGTQNSQTSGQSMTGRGSGVPTGPDCDSPNPADCI